MRARTIFWAVLAVMAGACVVPATPTFAGGPLHFMNWLTGKGVDLHQYDCDDCPPDTVCIQRQPVKECVVGKKLLYKSKIRYEWVSIPETRYRWKKMHITKEIDCPYCKPVCKTEESQNCFGVEKWETAASAGPCGEGCGESCCGDGGCGDGAGCGKLHCKNIVPQLEKTKCKYCGREPGETVVKAKVWSCVRVPYTVYRRVKRPVCVKQPCYEKVNVQVTRHVCTHCGGIGCGQCEQPACSHCNGDGCPSCTGVASDDQSAP